MTLENSSAFLFDDVRVEPATFRAFKASNPVQLEPKTLRLLLFLIENRARLIERDAILDRIWSGTHVTDNALAGEIAKLRKALGDDPKTPKYIQTVHTRGYRFIAEVEVRNASGSLSPANGKDSDSPAAKPSEGLQAPVAATETGPTDHAQHKSWTKQLAVALIVTSPVIRPTSLNSSANSRYF